MKEMEKEKHSDVFDDQSALDWLNEIFKNYASMVDVAIGAPAQSGRVSLKDLALAREMIQTLVMISSLIEKERKRSRVRPEDFAGRSWR